MSRWKIEKSGTGIEKSGTGIEKSGTGIEKSGTGIEKSGTGIEKSGTGISKSIFALCVATLALSTQVTAAVQTDPAGSLQIVVNDQKLAVSWIVDGSVFSGVSTLQGSFANLLLTEVSIAPPAPSDSELRVVGGGTGKEVVGGGTGKEVVGGGTGANVVGGGTGSNGLDPASINELVVGGGTGSDAIVITLPNGTAMQMEVSLGCNTASVSIMDANFVEVVNFSNVPVFGASSFCSSNGPSYGGLRDVAFSGPIGDFQ